MITKEQIVQKYERVHEHFSLKDLLGLSALVFGLLFSNSSFEPNTAQAQKDEPVTLEQPKDVQESPQPDDKQVTKETNVEKTKKVTKKKLKKAKRKQQRVSATSNPSRREL